MKYFFKCERCGQEAPIDKVILVTIPPDDPDRAYSLCGDCGFTVLAVYGADAKEVEE